MYMRRQQRTAILRLLCAGIAITCCCLIGSYVLSAPHHVRAVPTPIPIPEGPTKDYLEAKRDPTHEEEQVPIAQVEPEQDAPKAAPKAQHTVEATVENEAAQPPAPKKRPSNSDEDTDPSLSTTHTTPTNDDAHLKPALREILSLLPDEMHIRELTRPFEGTGKEKLREVGLRSRAYSTFFRAWEALHLVSTPTTTYIRDDILLYLRTADLSDLSHLSRAEIMRAYEAYRYFLVRLAGLLFPWTGPYFASHMALHASIHRGGRGIVLSGNDGQTPFLLTGIKTIRELGCELPIEVMYLGDEDLSEDSRADLEAIPGVVTRDLAQMVSDEGWKLAGWAGKPFAILLSSFREAIFIDADALFFVSPETLFEEPSYQKTGALFFRDRLVSPESKKRWLQSILPKPVSKSVRSSRLWTGESGHQQESGVVVVDKWRHFIPLLLVTRMNGPDRDGNEEKGITGIYDMVYGELHPTLPYPTLQSLSPSLTPTLDFRPNGITTLTPPLNRRQRNLLARLGARRRPLLQLPQRRRRHNGHPKRNLHLPPRRRLPRRRLHRLRAATRAPQHFGAALMVQRLAVG